MENFELSDVVRRVVDIMSERNITQSKMTKDLNLPTSIISDWKKGKTKPGVDKLVKLAGYFTMTLDMLILGHESGKSIIPFATRMDKTMIDRFHNLNDEHKKSVLEYIDFMLAAEIKDKSSKKHDA